MALRATDGREIKLTDTGPHERTVVYAYPRTGRPGEEPLVSDWDLIPGARGCTPESCGFRDQHREIAAAGAQVFGLSTQETSDQREVVERLRLPFSLLSGAELRLTRALELPTFRVADQVLLKRLTLVLRDSRIEHVFYPVFPHAEEVLAWLEENPLERPVDD